MLIKMKQSYWINCYFYIFYRPTQWCNNGEEGRGEIFACLERIECLKQFIWSKLF